MSTILDCDTCVMAGPGCADCVVTLLMKPVFLLASSSTEGPVFFTEVEQAAIDVLSGAGLLATQGSNVQHGKQLRALQQAA